MINPKDEAILDMMADEIEVSNELIADNSDYVDYLLNERKDGYSGDYESSDVLEFDETDDEWYLD
tara:strand:+ start:702 stop:896 length:195 start_codon:yes stop_codon:yes gene_type:complete